MIFLSREFARPREQSIVSVYSWEPFKERYHAPKFCGHRQCDDGDIMVLSCHMISQDRVMKKSCDFVDSSQSR